MFVGTGKNVRSLYVCFFNMIINVIIFFSVKGGHGDVWGYG